MNEIYNALIRYLPARRRAGSITEMEPVRPRAAVSIKKL